MMLKLDHARPAVSRYCSIIVYYSLAHWTRVRVLVQVLAPPEDLKGERTARRTHQSGARHVDPAIGTTGVPECARPAPPQREEEEEAQRIVWCLLTGSTWSVGAVPRCHETPVALLAASFVGGGVAHAKARATNSSRKMK